MKCSIRLGFTYVVAKNNNIILSIMTKIIPSVFIFMKNIHMVYYSLQAIRNISSIVEILNRT